MIFLLHYLKFHYFSACLSFKNRGYSYLGIRIGVRTARGVWVVTHRKLKSNLVKRLKFYEHSLELSCEKL